MIGGGSAGWALSASNATDVPLEAHQPHPVVPVQAVQLVIAVQRSTCGGKTTSQTSLSMPHSLDPRRILK